MRIVSSSWLDANGFWTKFSGDTIPPRCVAAREHELRIGPLGAHALREVLTADPARHDEVGDDQRDVRRARVPHAQCLEAVLDIDDAVAMAFEEAARRAAERRLVLDEQDRLTRATRMRTALLGHRRHLVEQWQAHLERRAAPELAVDRDPAVVLLDDAEHRREPQAGALTVRLRRVERLEDARHDVRGVLATARRGDDAARAERSACA